MLDEKVPLKWCDQKKKILTQFDHDSQRNIHFKAFDF